MRQGRRVQKHQVNNLTFVLQDKEMAEILLCHPV